jgi:hypothetical protein
MSGTDPDTGELELRIIGWLGGPRHVATHVALAQARDRAFGIDRGPDLGTDAPWPERASS